MVDFKNMVDSLSQRKAQRLKMEQDVVSEYKRGICERPDLAKKTILEAIASEYGLGSMQSVRYILQKYHVI